MKTNLAQSVRPSQDSKLCATATAMNTTSRKKESVRIPMKQWRMEEAQRQHVSEATIHHWLYNSDRYLHLTIERINKRVVFVVQ